MVINFILFAIIEIIRFGSFYPDCARSIFCCKFNVVVVGSQLCSGVCFELIAVISA